MKEEIKLFVLKILNDTELEKNLQACKSPEEAYAFASSVQEGFTYEEFVEAMTKLYEVANQDEIELSDEDLAKAAGGATTDEIVGTVITTVISAAVFGGAAV